MKEKLLDLIPRGLYALKAGTEVEDMNFEEILFLRRLSKDIVPLYVKIGGPEARNDMRFLADIQVDCIIAPMIESPYALKNFVTTLREIQKQHNTSTKAGINIETITAYMQLDSILHSEYIQDITHITAARTDLSGSLSLSPDDSRVMEICKEIILQTKRKGIPTSLGGNIHPKIITYLVETIDSDFINTRHMIIKRDYLQNDPVSLLKQHLEFELLLYEYFVRISSPFRRNLHQKRKLTLQNRLLDE